MKIQVGDRIQYWAGLGGSRLSEATITAIEVQVGLRDGSPAPAAPVASWDTEDDKQGAFVDLDNKSWTYASRVVKVVSEA